MCIRDRGKTERPEQQWMEQVYDRFRAENGNLGKAEADQLLFRKMYAAEPAKEMCIRDRFDGEDAAPPWGICVCRLP